MKTTLENGSFTILPDGGESLRDIAAAVIVSSYSGAGVYGMGFLQSTDAEFTKEMALRMLDGEDVSRDYCVNTNKPNDVYMDYVFGRRCKTHVRLFDGSDGSVPRVVGYVSTRDRNPVEVLGGAERIMKAAGAA